MNYEIVKGKRDNSSVYYIPEINKIFVVSKSSSIIYLKCYFNPNCKAKGFIENNKFIESGSEHNDSESVKSKLAYFNFWNELKKECSTSLTPNKIIFDDLYMRYKPGMPDVIVCYPEVESSMRKWKAKSTDKILTMAHSVDDIIKCIPPKAPTSPGIMINGEQFVHSIPQSCLDAGSSIILFQESTFDKIDINNLSVFADGTFGLFPSFFEQLFILHFLIGNHAFALVYVFMTRRTTEAYIDVFEFLKNRGLNITNIMLDFEAASRNAIRVVFPEVKVWGCQYHYAQAILRYIKINRLPKDISLVRKLSSLALLPTNLIQKAFFDIKKEIDETVHKILLSYVFRTWIRNPSVISTYGFSHNTNNICEAFNSYLKNYESIFVNFTKNMNFWRVKELFVKMHLKISIQLEDYINSNLTARIRSNSKSLYLLQKRTTVEILYQKLEKGMSPMEFINVIYGQKFESFIMNERNISEDVHFDAGGEMSVEYVIKTCAVCREDLPIVGQYDCRHTCLCESCLEIAREKYLRGQILTCIMCRKVSGLPGRIIYS